MPSDSEARGQESFAANAPPGQPRGKRGGGKWIGVAAGRNETTDPVLYTSSDWRRGLAIRLLGCSEVLCKRTM